MISRSSSFMSSANVGRGAVSLNTNVVMSQGSQVPPVSAAPDGCSAAVAGGVSAGSAAAGGGDGDRCAAGGVNDDPGAERHRKYRSDLAGVPHGAASSIAAVRLLAHSDRDSTPRYCEQQVVTGGARPGARWPTDEPE